MRPGPPSALTLSLLWSGLFATPAVAHGFAGSGFLHPITGVDHMLAMLAVGAWSAQLGGRAIWAVPTAFVSAMAAGFAVAFWMIALPGTEAAIALSLVGLGGAIALDRRLALPMAALATALFGMAHGHAHGNEVPLAADVPAFVVGFLVTTAGLHVAGAVGGLIVLDRPDGRRWLRAAGIATAAVGVFLLALGLQ